MSTPDDHFAAGPDCRVSVSAGGRVGGAGGCPTIRAGIVSPAGVQKIVAIISAPDDHFTAGPDCRVSSSASGRVGGAGGRPTIGAGIVSAAGVQRAVPSYPPQTIISLPVHTAVWRIVRAEGAFVGAGGRPTIRARIVSPAGVQVELPHTPPDDHFTARPHCRVDQIGSGRVGRACSCPTVRAGIVSPAGVRILTVISNSTPDDHFVAGPDCRVSVRAEGALAVLVGVQLSVTRICISHRCWSSRLIPTAPDDHFAAGPDCCVDPIWPRARWWCWWRSNYPCAGLYLPPVFKGPLQLCHPRRSFRCPTRPPCE